jgi:hypothetical protein
MRTTVKLGLPYPEPSDQPNVPADIQALAEKLDTVIPSLSSGSWTALSEATAASSNWQIASFQGAKSYYLVSMIIGIYYRGSAPLKGDSAGNLGDLKIATLNRTLLRPQVSAAGIMTTAESLLHVVIDAAGNIIIRGFANGAQSVPKDKGCNLTISYPSDRT